ncbi:MAG: hypothetical protein HY074_04755, partial [Deltaproteobacteria bacterium]|nr:hypothetical protein [Deltaproteobacteria bacterium]
MVTVSRQMGSGTKVGYARMALMLLAVFQTFWFGWALHRAEPAPWGDTKDYNYIADELAQGNLGVISEYYRPPGYPVLLLASRALNVKPTVAAVVFNRAMAVAAIALVPTPAGIGVVAGYLLLCSYSTVVSYENFVMSESPMPGFLLLAWVLGILAYRALVRRRYEVAVALLGAQYVWLTSLKPAFKGYCVLELCVLGLFCALGLPRLARGGYKRVALNVLVLFAFTALVNGVVFRNSGGVPMVLNKAITLVHVLPFLTPGQVAALPPKVQKTYG